MVRLESVNDKDFWKSGVLHAVFGLIVMILSPCSPSLVCWMGKQSIIIGNHDIPMQTFYFYYIFRSVRTVRII